MRKYRHGSSEIETFVQIIEDELRKGKGSIYEVIEAGKCSNYQLGLSVK